MEYSLSSARSIERMLYKGIVLTEDVKNNAFPSLPPMEKAILEIESAAQNYKYAIFYTPYVRTKDDGTWFIDIYLTYDENNLEPFRKKTQTENIVMRRLIIAPGYMMTEEDEYIFTCLHSAIWINYNERVTGDFVKELDEVAPELHMKRYESLVEWVRESTEYKHWYFGHLHLDEDLFRHQTCLWFQFRNMETNEVVE